MAFFKKCIECGEEFKVDRSIAHRRKTCSMKCIAEIRKRITIEIEGKGTIGGCIECSSSFARCIRGQRFCSLSCSSTATNRLRDKSTYAKKHGENRKTVEYNIWQGMISRCTNPRNPRYHRYRGRGISVCERWRNYESFLSDMGRRPSVEHSIDRVNNNGNYDPSNCRWATRSEQYANMSRTKTCSKCGTEGHQKRKCNAA